MDVFSYAVSESGVRILKYSRGIEDDDFPYPNYPSEYAKVSVVLHAISALEDDLLCKINLGGSEGFELGLQNPMLNRPRNQIGGRFRAIQPLETLLCPECGEKMERFASIANRLPSDELQTDNDFVQVVFHLCASCVSVSVVNYCD